ncbi:MAG: aspartate-semialdehyde dehydrogenase [Xanthomonadales bacterium]|nr:aspartate-semialdehyde dehydrogenase [Gammaproteobacteria bacterium]MBT8051261.1 aspartate-semialdehyde dehydrogenase [Gammaproteobacteria bacterium]MBT8056653.1 aspartate-semialdehyde dehydrogenase [Gammaproteobacteria bacterium]NNJ80532.1 aspartate-semialdehyde dehydrogenase [Xanthomonadales bacterium]NNL03915.1 aspartate-semialdehyde dehydrogenase [Xanthomonadales bacterium]
MDNVRKIAVVGATGAVGEVMLSILAERGHQAADISALASERSAGKEVEFGDRRLITKDLADFNFAGIDYALFSAGGSVSERYAPIAAGSGAVVIDNTSAFRYVDDIPLVVPEVNPHHLDGVGPGSIVANPNCSTIQMLVALAPIQREAGIDRINVATYQSVSGAGAEALRELAEQTIARLSFKEPVLNKFAQPIAFNVLPQIDTLQDNGYSREEMKMVWETQKIFEDPSIRVNATAVRVPVFYGHSEAVHLETRDDIAMERVRELLGNAEGVVVVDGEDMMHPTAVTHGAGEDPVYVGRLRRDISHPRGINMWVVADNIRKGAALNAVQIMERLERSKV